MPHQVIIIRPRPEGGEGLSEDVAEAIAQTYDRVAEAGGQIVASHTLQIAQYPRITEELFLVAEVPEVTDSQTVTSILVGKRY